MWLIGKRLMNILILNLIDMIQSKPAKTNYPILRAIANRWSPVIFSDEKIEEEKILLLLEAARWAPSSYNEQPWQYIIGFKGDENYKKLSESLLEGNSWAKNAPVLICSVAKKYFTRGNKLNHHHLHDTGMATMALVLQATKMDLYSHQMSGFDMEKMRTSFGIDDDLELGSMIAIGNPGNSDDATEDMIERDSAPRERKDLESLIWG